MSKYPPPIPPRSSWAGTRRNVFTQHPQPRGSSTSSYVWNQYSPDRIGRLVELGSGRARARAQARLDPAPCLDPTPSRCRLRVPESVDAGNSLTSTSMPLARRHHRLWCPCLPKSAGHKRLWTREEAGRGAHGDSERRVPEMDYPTRTQTVHGSTTVRHHFARNSEMRIHPRWPVGCPHSRRRRANRGARSPAPSVAIDTRPGQRCRRSATGRPCPSPRRRSAP